MNGTVGTLLVTIGPAGAGKTTWRQRHAPPDTAVVSLDELRARYSVCGCSGDHRANHNATRHGFARTAAVLAAGGTVLWDVTAYRADFRRRLLTLAAEHRARAVGVLLLPPVAVALARNAARDNRVCSGCGTARRVPEHVVRHMHTAIIRDLPRLHREGWHTLHFRAPTTRRDAA